MGSSLRSPCADCATPAYGLRCKSCDSKARATEIEGRRVDRRLRDRAAVGMSAHARGALLASWKRQGVRCAYCNVATADTIDHVIPLIRGGTNREGNLLPACRPCNSSKGARTVAEWRHGRRYDPSRSVRLAALAPRQVNYSSRTCKVYFGTCEHCGAAWSSRNAGTRMCPLHRGWFRASLAAPCADCGTPLPFVTRPILRCKPCKSERARERRRARRKAYGKGRCVDCGGPRWGKQRCADCFRVAGGVDSPLAA